MKLPIPKPTKPQRAKGTSSVIEAWEKYNQDPDKWSKVGSATRSTVYINEESFVAEVDSMGMISVLHQRVCDKLGIKIVKAVDMNIRMFNMTSEKRTFGLTEPVTIRMNRNVVVHQVATIYRIPSS